MELKVVRTDVKGRATLGTSYGGKSFYVLHLPGGQVELIPRSEDPLKKLSELGKGAKWKSIREMRESVEEAIKGEVAQRVRRH